MICLAKETYPQTWPRTDQDRSPQGPIQEEERTQETMNIQRILTGIGVTLVSIFLINTLAARPGIFRQLFRGQMG